MSKIVTVYRWESGHVRGSPQHSIKTETHRQGRTFKQQVSFSLSYSQNIRQIPQAKLGGRNY